MYWRKGKKRLYPTRSDQKATRKIVRLPRNCPETTQKLPLDITPVQKEIIDFLLKCPYAGRKGISSHLDSLSEDGVKYNLKILQQKGIIKRIGPNKGGYWKVLIFE